MKIKALCVAAAVACMAVQAQAHFVLVSPAASFVQNRLGDPQKIAPCGGVSANPARGTAANPGIPSGATTELKGGSTFHLLLQETIFHPGHYRVALARSASQLPADPVVTTRDTQRGALSVSAVIQNPPVPPVLVDGLFPHTERPTGLFEADIPIPNINCRGCLLQVVEFMAEHGLNADGDFSYHHCAIVKIAADPEKPADTHWN